jgi:hypothetical protein
MVFEYYIKEWWPHGRHLGATSAIFGFTPMQSTDHEVVNDRVSKALHYPSTLSIEAILASSSCRMQLVRNKPFVDPHLCEVLYLSAIASLRKRLKMDVPVDEQLLLDVSGLIYAEIFNKSGPSADVLWNICKETIIQLGGLAKVPPMTALAALSTDFFVANAKLKRPILDPYIRPALLGVHEAVPSTSSAKLQDLVAELDPRCQAIIELAHYLGSQWATLWELPKIHRTLQSLRTHRDRFSKNFRSPLAAVPGCTTGDTVPLSVLEADCKALRMKMWAFNAYMAFASVTDDDDSSVLTAAAPPRWAQEAISFLWTDIDTIESLLERTGWLLRQDHVCWVAVLGIFTSWTDGDREAYGRILKVAARRLGIESFGGLMEELQGQMPLEMVAGYDENLLRSCFESRRVVEI